MNLQSIFANRISGMKASEIRELLKLLDQPDIISFAGGIPDPALFPQEAFQDAMQAALTGATGRVALQYAPSEGYLPLRQWIADHMGTLGIPCDADNILITAGSQQALDYLGKMFLNKGDTALVGWPTYLGALGAFNAYQPRFDRLDPSANRPVADIMADAAAGGGTVKFAYVSPDFANPTGVTLNAVQRHTILDMAEHMDCAVIEDAAYQSLRYRGDDIPPLLAMDIERSGGIENTRTVYLGSFSKTLSPGLRVGWAVAAKPVIQQMVLLKQAGDLQTATLNQIAIADVARRVFDPHIRVLRDAYGTRMQAMLAALSRTMPEGVTWTDPDGGMFIWVTLPRGMDAKVVLQNALAAKVAFVPGQAFFADGSNENSLRLNFSLATEDTINTGIGRLAGVIADMM